MRFVLVPSHTWSYRDLLSGKGGGVDADLLLSVSVSQQGRLHQHQGETCWESHSNANHHEERGTMANDNWLINARWEEGGGGGANLWGLGAGA